MSTAERKTAIAGLAVIQERAGTWGTPTPVGLQKPPCSNVLLTAGLQNQTECYQQ
jgi:hypothetical protein